MTAAGSTRSAGGRHDFFSEGDYWWPDPKNPDGPYIQRDGISNPDNFVEHRRAMIRLSLIVPALAAANTSWQETGSLQDHAAGRLRAWFVDDATRMNPNLQYAQAIKGRFTGRGTGIIDTRCHLVEVPRAAGQPEHSGAAVWTESGSGSRPISSGWRATHPYGMAGAGHEEQPRDLLGGAGGGICRAHRQFCADGLVPRAFQNGTDSQSAGAGRKLSRELRRTKPYGYSIFNLDADGDHRTDPDYPGGQYFGNGGCPTAAAWRRRWPICTRSWPTKRSGRCRRT